MLGGSIHGFSAALWVHAEDMREPGAAAVVMSITVWPRKLTARLSALVRETVGWDSIRLQGHAGS
jgi:hypothetical protein